MAIELVWTYDKCPLNTGELDFQVYVDGQPLFRDPNKTDKEAPGRYIYIEDAKGLQEKINTIRQDKMQKTVKKSY